MNKRNAVLGEFRSSTRKSGPRVLILSGVGMVGLNLACANIMVVMVYISSFDACKWMLTLWKDTLWSEQDDRQLRGRIYRHPQNKPVHIYRAIALRTADVFLNNISFSKGAMHEAFIGADQEISKLSVLLPESVASYFFMEDSYSRMTTRPATTYCRRPVTQILMFVMKKR